MSSHEYIQKKNSQQSTPPTTTNTFTSRPFAPEVENAAPTEPISVEQIQAAQQFGYKAVSLKTFVPSSIVEASPKEEAEIEIESPKLHSNTPSETPPEISPQVPRIQRQPDEEKASARSEKIAEKPRENIQAKVEITENKPVPEITNSTETIPPKIRKSPRKVTPNSSQNRPPQINRQNFAIIPKTIQPKIANWDELNLSGSNQSLTNKNPYVQRLTLTNSPDIGKPKSADLTQIIGRDSGLNKNPIQRKTEDKSAEKSPVGQEIQTLFARQLQPQTLPSPPTPQPSLTPKNNPPPPGFLASNKQKHIQLQTETNKTDKKPLIPKQFSNYSPSSPEIPHQPLSISTTNPNIQRDILGIPTSIDEAKSKILSPVAQLATRIPGYPLLTVILGKDPINGASVSRNGTNLIRGILSLVPGGDNIFNNLQQSGAIDKAFNWFNSQITKLNLTWETIKGLFKQAWDSLGMSDILSPSGALDKIKNVFTQPIDRIKNFAVSASTKVMEFVFEGIMGAGGAKVMGIIKNAGGAFNNILKDPIAFCGNLVGAVRGGFQKFSGNIATHLKNGLTGWLFGALAGAGLTLPAQFDLKGIISIVLQVVGATYEKLRGKLVNKVGEQKVGRLEKTFDFLKGIITGGLVTAWQKIAEFTGNLQEMVMGGIKEWVKNSIITAAITKLISMFNPAGAIVQAVMAIYNTVIFFVERGAQIAALGEAVFSSIGSIAAGNVAGAANYVEQTMGRTLPVVISFLARLIGLGGISGEIKNVIKRVQGKVEDAVSRVVEFIVEKGKRLLGKSGGEKKDEIDKSEDRTKEQKEADLAKSVAEVEHLMDKEGTTPKTVEAKLPELKSKYQLKSANIVNTERDTYYVEVEINPKNKSKEGNSQPKRGHHIFNNGLRKTVDALSSIVASSSEKPLIQAVQEITNILNSDAFELTIDEKDGKGETGGDRNSREYGVLQQEFITRLNEVINLKKESDPSGLVQLLNKWLDSAIDTEAEQKLKTEGNSQDKAKLQEGKKKLDQIRNRLREAIQQLPTNQSLNQSPEIVAAWTRLRHGIEAAQILIDEKYIQSETKKKEGHIKLQDVIKTLNQNSQDLKVLNALLKEQRNRWNEANDFKVQDDDDKKLLLEEIEAIIKVVEEEIMPDLKRIEVPT